MPGAAMVGDTTVCSTASPEEPARARPSHEPLGVSSGGVANSEAASRGPAG